MQIIFKHIHSRSVMGFIHCYKRFAILIICTITLSFCKAPLKQNDTSVGDSLIIKLPAPAFLSIPERNKLQFSCQQWYDSTLGKTGFNGGILIAKGGNVVFEKYKGTGHLGSGEPITNTTAFNIASVSKTFTAMSVLKLWQDGKINIDDEFSKYFPSFNYPGVTIRTLLNHRSGLPNYLYFMEDLGWDKSVFVKNQDVLDYLITRKTELTNISRPNTHFTYCNTNYALLALLTEKITGMPFPQFIQKEFFLPLQMKHSFIVSASDSARVIPSYDWRGQEIPINYLDLVYGDKNVNTTASDLLIWDRALRTNMIFKPEILQQAFSPYSNEKPGIKNYGLGWRMNIYPNGKKMIFHNGWWHGYNAVFIRLIDEDATIIVMGNRYTNAIYKAKNIATIFTGSYLTDDEDEMENGKTVDSLVLKK